MGEWGSDEEARKQLKAANAKADAAVDSAGVKAHPRVLAIKKALENTCGHPPLERAPAKRTPRKGRK